MRFIYVKGWSVTLLLVAIGVAQLISIALRRHFISWSLTSERVIENKGILARHRREMELADVRSVDVEQRFMQRAMGLGDVIIASAASADYAIRLYDIPDPEGVAETLRRARLKRSPLSESGADRPFTNGPLRTRDRRNWRADNPVRDGGKIVGTESLKV